MHFISHCGNLSLDTMRRVGETPNGLNEALVCRALELARQRGVSQVSLNYAGLGQLVRTGHEQRRARRLGARVVMKLLGSRFQMQRLVTFNDKFSPDWRPRYLVFQSRLALPRTVLRVLQAEGYVQQPRGSRLRDGSVSLPRALPRTHAEPPGIGDAR
jgi:lysyl-tRNA synthetase class 2